MDVGNVSALALSPYPTTLSTTTGSSATSSGSPQDSAVLKGMVKAASSGTADSSGIQPDSDYLTSLVGSNILAPQVSGVYSASQLNSAAAFTVSALSAASTTFGGLDSTSASLLFSGLNSSGLDGFSSSAINMNAAVALASYANHQAGIPTGTIGAAATTATSSLDPTQPTSVQAAIQAAQSTSLTSSLNLFG